MYYICADVTTNPYNHPTWQIKVYQSIILTIMMTLFDGEFIG